MCVPNEPKTSSRAQLSRRILRDSVYDAILELLLNNEFEPGSSLRIDTLARQLGVSPTPVREALAELEHTGLIHRAALRGYTVASPLGKERIAELFEARCILEVESLKLALPASHEAVERLRERHQRHLQTADLVLAATEDDGSDMSFTLSRDYFDADWGFHLELLGMSSNTYLLQMAKSLAPHLHRMRQSPQGTPNDVRQAITEHGVILDAVESGDTAAAIAAMAAHIDSVRARAMEDASAAAVTSP